MPSIRPVDPLVLQQAERADQGRPRFLRLDYIVDVATLGRHVWVGKALLVILYQLVETPARVERACQDAGLVADDPDHLAVEAGEPDHEVLSEMFLDFQETALIDDGADRAFHVVGLLRTLWYQGL